MTLDIPPAVWWSTIVALIAGLGGVLVTLVRRVDVLVATIGALSIEVRGLHHRLGEIVDRQEEHDRLLGTTREEAAIERGRLNALEERVDRVSAGCPSHLVLVGGREGEEGA